MPSRNPCALGLLQTIHRNLANQPRLHSGRGFFRITFDNHPMSSHAGAPEPKLKVPPGQDEAAITTKVKELLAPNAETRTSWALVLDGAGLQRSFRFKTFNKTWVSRETMRVSFLLSHYGLMKVAGVHECSGGAMQSAKSSS